MAVEGVEMADSQRKVLIVDDEREFLVLLGKMVMNKGYKVLAADNGNDALDIAKREKPDIIILDIMMPKMGGREVGQKLKEREETRNIPVIFLTGLITAQESENSDHKVAGNIIFAKPCRMEELLSAIDKLVEGKPSAG